MRSRGIVHVQNFFVRRKAHAVGLAKIIRFQMKLSIRRNPEEPLEIQVLFSFQTEDRHSAVGRVAEVNRFVGPKNNVVQDC